MEQALRARHRHERGDLATTARLAEYRDQIRIAAEPFDVVADPLQRGDDVQHPRRSRQRELAACRFAEVREPEDVQPMVDRDHDHIARASEAHAVGDR
jgi:hypothetical protein